MKDSNQWFAIPLAPHHRFMAAFRIVVHKMKIHPLSLLYALVYQQTQDDIKREGAFVPMSVVKENGLASIRGYFFDTYEQEEALVHYLNKQITTKYFIRPKVSTARTRTRKDDQNIKDNIDNLLSAVFQNIEL